MLSIPYLTKAGVVTIRFRRIDLDPENPGDGPKYRSLPADPPRPFNVNDLLDPGPVICVTEGEFDAMTAKQATRLPVIGWPGVSSWRDKYARLLKGYDVVYGLADGDDKGQGVEFMERIAEDVENFRIVPMPPGYDVNKYVMEYGPEALAKRLEVRT
jgi:DNA primase